MSSLAATQADGYYIPPEYFEDGHYKKKTLNQFQNSKGHNVFLTDSVVRFELPYNGVCVGCHHCIMRGTRFNAQKSHAGNYRSTKIYEFVMKCRNCSKCVFVIRTNPSQQTFDYVKGIQKRSAATTTIPTTSSTDNKDEISILESNLTSTKKQTNHMAQLEHQAQELRKAVSERQQLESLQQIQMDTYRDDAHNNANIRAKYRQERNAKRQRQQEASKLGLGRGIELLPLQEQEQVSAFPELLLVRDMAKKDERQRFSKVRTESIFTSRAGTQGSTSTSHPTISPRGEHHRQERNLDSSNYSNNHNKKQQRERKSSAAVIEQATVEKTTIATTIPNISTRSKNEEDILRESVSVPIKSTSLMTTSSALLVDYSSSSAEEEEDEET